MANLVEVHVRARLDLDALQDLKYQFGLDAEQEAIAALCDTLLVELVRQVVRAGLDRDMAVAEVVSRGVLKTLVENALAVDEARDSDG